MDFEKTIAFDQDMRENSLGALVGYPIKLPLFPLYLAFFAADHGRPVHMAAFAPFQGHFYNYMNPEANDEREI
ncbi:MAG: hypothetical protein HY671_07980 [Chloroflexi bacterium]|nr:hypothetical protein [Chloroflexota bacterium]